MKNFSIFKSISMVIGVIIMFTIFITKTGHSQTAEPKGKKKTIILKVTADKDGKNIVIDTTFITPEGTDPKEIEEMAEKLQKEMQGLEKEMEEVQVRVLLDLPDSAMIDSLHNVIDKMVILKKGPRKHMKIYANKPHEFEYEFNVPCPSDHMTGHEIFEGPGWSGYLGDQDKRVFRFEDKGQTLTDILGDIPMEKVRNYSIKNTKYGKKIVIEIED